MARLKALPALDVIRGFKGTLDFYLWKGLPCVRKWPHTPRSRRTPGTIAAAALFGGILQSYRLVAPSVLEAYQANAKGIPRTPRDVYVSAVLGHLHERTIPPEPEPEPEPEAIHMTGSWINPETPTVSSSAEAWKGNFAKPMRDILLHALGVQGDWWQGSTIKFGVFTVEAGLISAVIYKSAGFTLPPITDVNPCTARISEAFDPPWQLTAGTEYLIMAGRTDGADNFPLGIFYTSPVKAAPFPAHEPPTGSGMVAKADPQVGDAVATWAGSRHLFATWTYPPILTPALQRDRLDANRSP